MREIVHELDEKEEHLEVKESPLDIKVFIKGKQFGEIWDKGHGVALLARTMNINLSEGNILVCGDSDSDLPMLDFCLRHNPQGVYTIWVTRDNRLREKV